MKGLLESAAPKQETNGLEEQIDLATQVVREVVYSDGAAESLFGIIDQGNTIGAGLGKAVVMAVSPIVTAMHEKEPNLDPNIWLMDGGVLDNLLEELVSLMAEGGVEISDEDVMEARDTVEQDVAKMVEQGGQNEPVR